MTTLQPDRHTSIIHVDTFTLHTGDDDDRNNEMKLNLLSICPLVGLFYLFNTLMFKDINLGIINCQFVLLKAGHNDQKLN